MTSDLVVDLHYVYILKNYSTEHYPVFEEILRLLLNDFEDFLREWENSTVTVYFVDRIGNHHHMQYRGVPPLRATIPHHRLKLRCPANIDPEIKEMVQLIMNNEAVLVPALPRYRA
jgi:hypothetical protein